MLKIQKFAREKKQRLHRSLTPKQARTLVAALAVMLAITLVSSAAFLGIEAALMCLTAILGLATWRESRIAKHEKQNVQVRLDKLARERGSVIEVLCSALGLEENMKSAQAQRVADLAASVAWQMGLKEDQVSAVRQAAVLHDVGKIGIAEDVLSKSDTLTDREWQTMMRHPEVGHEILNEVQSLRGVAEVVYTHHERFDGQGYPRGLKGDDIPVASRIYAVVDAYAAMTSERPYRKKMDHEMAVREIVRNSLTQFDPQVVEAFLEAMEATTPRSASANGRPFAEETVSSQV
jgi:HD-GYP domain-containing protein (c-di-GMP phosphodiesterase class II)